MHHGGYTGQAQGFLGRTARVPESTQLCSGLDTILSFRAQRLRREGTSCVWGEFGESLEREVLLLLGFVCDFSLLPLGNGRDQGVSPRKRTVAEVSRSRHGNDHNQGWEVSWPPLRREGLGKSWGRRKGVSEIRERRGGERRGAERGENSVEQTEGGSARERMNVFCFTRFGLKMPGELLQ